MVTVERPQPTVRLSRRSHQLLWETSEVDRWNRVSFEFAGLLRWFPVATDRIVGLSPTVDRGRAMVSTRPPCGTVSTAGLHDDLSLSLSSLSLSLSSLSLLSLFINREGRWGTTDNFATSFLHFSPFSTALWDLANSRPVHFLMLSSHLSLCLPCLLFPFTVPKKLVLARPDQRETWPSPCSLRFFMMVRRLSCGPTACWILARTSSLVTWS